MINDLVADIAWTTLRPPFRTAASYKVFAALARALAGVRTTETDQVSVEILRGALVESVSSFGGSDKQALLAAGLVLTDLAIQGWQIRLYRRRVEVRPPAQVSEDRGAEKARIRRQELVKRDAQLRQAPVLAFLRSMERTRVFNGRFTSIFSLMRDGRELADGLRKACGQSDNEIGRAHV